MFYLYPLTVFFENFPYNGLRLCLPCFHVFQWFSIQKQPPEVFCKKFVLKNYAKSTGEHLCQSLQGIIQTKMEVGIQFWAPNLGLSPKYD